MKILVVHNFYKLSGGEDAVVMSEVDLLKSKGHEVSLLSVHNDDIDTPWKKLKTAMGTVYNISSRNAVARRLREFRPDIMHVHNFFPQLSPSVFSASRGAKVPSVMTLHNFRTLCPTGVLYHNGKICEQSLHGSAWWAIRERVYRGSFWGTLIVASMVEWHKRARTWWYKVDRFIALTSFAKEKFVEASFPESLLDVKANSASGPPIGVVTNSRERHGALFVGRLSEEKGLRSLIAAWDGIAYPLRIAGDGPMSPWIDAQRNPSVQRLGHLDKGSIQSEMLRAAFLIVPSVCYEMFPVALAEAFGCGLPVLASRLGGVAALVEEGSTGLQFTADDAEDLRRKILWAASNSLEMQRMGRNARTRFEEAYTPEANYRNLIGIYEDTIRKIRGKIA